MKDYNVKLRNLLTSHTLGWSWNWNTLKIEVCEYDGWVCDVEVIGVPSGLRVIRETTTLPKIKLTRDLSIEEKTARWKWKNPPLVFLYCESRRWELKIRCIYECRCDERLQTKTKEFTLLGYTGLVVELEHLKIETRLQTSRLLTSSSKVELLKLQKN